MTRRAALLHAGLFYAAFVWGSTFVMVKDALSGVDPFALCGWRFLLAAACLLPFLLRGGRWRRHPREGAVLAFLLSILYGAQTQGLLYTSAANSGFITGTFILFVPGFMFLRDRRVPGAGAWAAVLLALVGLRLVTGGPSGINPGDALTLLAALAYAAHLFAMDRWVRGEVDMTALAFQQFWMAGAACMLFAAFAGRPFGAAPRSAGAIVFLTLVPTLSAYAAQMLAQREIAPLTVSLVFALEPVFAALFAWTLGGEPFRPLSALGGALIVSAIIVGELWGRESANLPESASSLPPPSGGGQGGGEHFFQRHCFKTNGRTKVLPYPRPFPEGEGRQ
ncbi:MAG: DMT family transporter [Elusimicrobiota bacterium]|jgi:drug/metabolite transporter (DMT)-like permease